MNCERTRELLLLTSSGEASPDSAALLDRHLATCPECQAFREETEWILSAMGLASLEADVSECTLGRIEAAARDARPRAGRADLPARAGGPSFWQTWRPALTYGAAAVVMVSLGIGHLRRSQADLSAVAGGATASPTPAALVWNPALDEELNTLETVLTLAFEGMEESAPETAEDIASDLIRLEGWEI